LNFAAARDGFALADQAASFSEKYPNSPVQPIAQHILSKSREEAEKWFSKIYSDISRLTSEKTIGRPRPCSTAFPPPKSPRTSRLCSRKNDWKFLPSPKCR